MTDPVAVPQVRLAPARVHGRWLVRPPREAGTGHWLVGFHGQAETAETQFERLEGVGAGPGWGVVSVQALHRHYVGRAHAVGATWMTSQDRDLAIADNLAWVDGVLDALAREAGEPRLLVYAGFSQGAAMAYRAAWRGRRPAAAVIAVGGDVPPELLAREDAPRLRVLAATGAGDGWYTPARLASDAAALRARGVAVTELVFTGGHDWTDAASAAAARLLGGLAAGA